MRFGILQPPLSGGDMLKKDRNAMLYSGRGGFEGAQIVVLLRFTLNAS